jgi:hypothetical protein
MMMMIMTCVIAYLNVHTMTVAISADKGFHRIFVDEDNAIIVDVVTWYNFTVLLFTWERKKEKKRHRDEKKEEEREKRGGGGGQITGDPCSSLNSICKINA